MFPFPDQLTEKWLSLNLGFLTPFEKAGWDFQKSSNKSLILADEKSKQEKIGKTLGSILPLNSLDSQRGPMQAVIFFSNPEDANVISQVINFLFNETNHIFAESFTASNTNIKMNQLPHVLCTTPVSLRGYFPDFNFSQFQIQYCIVDNADIHLKANSLHILFEYLDQIQTNSPHTKYIINSKSPKNCLNKYDKYLNK